MKQFRRYIQDNSRILLGVLLAALVLSWLLLSRLGTLPGGISLGEQRVALTSYGWHGLYQQPLYLPLNLARSVIFFVSGHHGQLLTRLPNVVFGIVTIISFAWLLHLWHGTRTALLATVLFATSAWVIHVSRLASNDVLYLWAIPVLLLAHGALQRRPEQPLLFYGSLALWGAMLYLPGGVWLVIMSAFWQRNLLLQGWRQWRTWWQRLLTVLTVAIWIPLLAIDLTRAGTLQTWLGLPQHWATPLSLVKQLGDVFLHLFVRGPADPELWLGRAPLLDIFTLVMVALGIYFYVSHWKAARSRIITSYSVIGVLLVAIGGPVSLSLLVPVLYLCAATGIAYLLHEWLQVFPHNPFARSLGIGLVVLAVLLSSTYNYRAYFVAWNYDPATKATFSYHR